MFKEEYMRIKEIKEINNYRNLSGLTVSFSESLNYIIGENNIGKTNILELINSIFSTGKFVEKDFFDITQPISIRFTIEYEDECIGFFEDNFDVDDSNAITLVAEQEVVDGRISYYHDTPNMTPISYSTVRKINTLYYYAQRMPSKEVDFKRTSGSGKVLNYLIQKSLAAIGLEERDVLNRNELDNVIKEINKSVEKISSITGDPINACLDPVMDKVISRILLLGDENGRELSSLGEGIQYAFSIILQIIDEIYDTKISRKPEEFEERVVSVNGQKYYPVLLLLDEPEIHQHPYNQIRYRPEDEQEEYMHQIQYINNKKPAGYYNTGKDFQKTMKNLDIKPDYFFNEFNSMKDSVERDREDQERTFIKKAVKTYTNQSPNKIGEEYYIIENVKKSEDYKDAPKIRNYRDYDHQSYEGYNKLKKFQRNRPFPHKNNFNTEINVARSQSYLEPVAQKICNIIIKAEPKKEKDKEKKLKSDKKPKNEGFTKNMEIEENVAQGSAVPYKKINVNVKKDSKPKLSLEENIYDDNNENVNNNLKKEKEMNNDNKINNLENEKEILRNKAIENNKEKNIRIEGQNMRDLRGQEEEIEDEDEQGEAQMQELENEEEIEEGQEQIEDEQNDQGEIEQLEEEEDNNNNKMIEYENEEESEGINKEEIEELEEEEQHQIQLSNNIKDKQNDYKLQKENEINLVGIKEKKPIMKIGKFQLFQKGNNVNQKQKKTYSRLRIIRDNKIQIKGIKKQSKSFLEINKESNVELLRKENNPIIEIERVQSIQHNSRIKPKKIYKKRIFKIIKNRDNNVNIIPENKNKEPILEMQKVQNFEQPRNKKRKPIIKNKNIKFKISKIKDANFVLEKIENDSLVVEKAQNHEQIQNKKPKIKIKNKYIKFKVCKIKDANFVLEKIEPEPELQIENTEIFEQVQNKKMKNKKKSDSAKFKISKIKDANFLLEKIEEEPELIIDNTAIYEKIQNKKAPKRKKNKFNKIKISKIKDANFIIEKIEEESDLQIENVYQLKKRINLSSLKFVKLKMEM